ncbi:MAG: tetratricopeptide repeat protein [Desulfovibrio sp.]|jgi:tetratricopeptide (TPR) repeat protein|nr:tetratricopeptide repeat protein [Desulfovibrio sp.]
MSEDQAGSDLNESKQQKIRGVFSSQEVKKVGTGTTTRKTIQKAFWYCEEKSDGSLEMQPLNPNYVPSGPKKSVSREEFLTHFSPEPELYVSTVYPKMREITKTVAMADRHRAHNELYSAEMEYNKVLHVDEENVRANFGLGLTYLEHGDTSKAQNIFSRLVKLDGAFEEEHKHLFNEFGIKLRKNGMVDHAVDYYERALSLAHKDENLFYNLARAWLEKKNIDKVLEYLLKSLELNPKLEPAIKFLAWLEEKNLVPESKKQDVTVAVARGRAD